MQGSNNAIHFVALHTITQILHKNIFPKPFLLSLFCLLCLIIFMLVLHYLTGLLLRIYCKNYCMHYAICIVESTFGKIMENHYFILNLYLSSYIFSS
ncbi:hypothetical protein KsCSTR_35130 [Candidatus Kuenenia stuttgartiensis]|uniref:Uncharacterized protein n=1 Tax=Kuenenia stuttgartiensis TaxID=174633 RepID=Q1Q6U6_KUEST|nr:hypothetical protein KsCSTR_35130 [Candidatus Kuenenia stuttgartiensis]CAJ73297.1 unknown protein [Candidatus Kuenenia stuttgartiensis]